MADADRRRLLAARAQREELLLMLNRTAALEKTGRWLKADEAADAWGRELAGLIAAMEAWLSGAAAESVAGLADPREIGRTLRGGFRELRRRLAETAAAG